MSSIHQPHAPIALMGALHEELADLLGALDQAGVVQVAGREFRVGRLDGHLVVAALSRVGKVAAATTATVLLERFDARAVLFTGVAGGMGAEVAVGDVVVATELLQHDLDASPLFTRYEVPLTGRSRFPTDPQWRDALERAAIDVLADATALIGADAATEFGLVRPRLHTGLVISGDCFVSGATAVQALRSALPDALAVEMEGAAVAQVCHDYGVPFAAVRTISDCADDTAARDFTRFVQVVARRYSAAVVRGALRAASHAINP